MQELQQLEENIRNIHYIKQNADRKRINMQSSKNLNQTAIINSNTSFDQSPSQQYGKLDDTTNIYQQDYFNKRSGSNNDRLLLGPYDNSNRLNENLQSNAHSRINLRANLDQISKAGNDIVSSYQSSRNTNLNVKAYSTNKIGELKAKQHEDEWAKILKADLEKKTQIEKEKNLSMQNQQKNLKDFLQMQVEEKKRKEENEKLLKHNELIDLVGSLKNDITHIDKEKTQQIQKRMFEKEVISGQLQLDQRRKQINRQMKYEEDLYSETSLPFDKYKQKEIIEKKEKEKQFSLMNEKCIQIKQEQKVIRKLENSKGDEPFLDRLMVKNFKQYQNEYDQRVKNQELSAEVYRKAHQDKQSFQELAYQDEIRANQFSNVQQQRQQQYNGLVDYKKQKDLDEMKKWQQIYDKERMQKEQAQKEQFNMDKIKMDQHIQHVKMDERRKLEEMKIQQAQYRYQIGNQVNEKITNNFISNHKLGSKELMTNRRELEIAHNLL
eukprot:403335883